MDLTEIVNTIKKEFGKGADIKLASDEPEIEEFISTGVKAINLCIHSKGLPMEGKITELLGLFSSGKSLLLQTIIALIQRRYGAVGILVDRENAYTKSRGHQLGINNEHLILAGAKDVPTAKEAFDFMSTSIEAIRTQSKNTKVFLGMDSIAAFDKVPKIKKKMKDGEMIEVVMESKADMGKKAKLVHEGMRKLLNYLDKNTMFVFCNQITYMPGIMFGNPQTTTSGEAPKYYPNVRLQLEQGRKLTDPARGGEVTGQCINCTIIKSRLDAAYRSCEVPFYYKTGLPFFGGYLSILVDRNLCETNTEKGPNAYKAIFYTNGPNGANYSPIFEILEQPELLFKKHPGYGKYKGNKGKKDGNN